MTDRVTRASNASTHPGVVDLPPTTRRSTQEVQAEKKAKAAAKEQAAVQKATNIQRVAELENAAKQKARDTDHKANNPKNTATMSRAKRTRPQPDVVNEETGDRGKPAKKAKQTSADRETVVPHWAIEDAAHQNERSDHQNIGENIEEEDPVIGALIRESEPSAVGSKHELGSNDESEIDDGANEIEDEEPDTNIMLKKGGKKRSKGQIARDQIGAAASAMTIPGPKKSVRASGHPSKRSKDSHPPSGLIPNWQDPPLTQPLTFLRKRRSHAALALSTLPPDAETFCSEILCRSQLKHTPSYTTIASTSEPASGDIPAFSYGGFLADEEESEGPEAKAFRSEEPAMKYGSITKIQEIHAAPSVRINHAMITKSQKKKEISYDSLPHGTKNCFKQELIPLALDTTGALKPWQTLSDDAIIEVWNLVYGADYPIAKDDITSERFVVAKTLLKRAISTWLHRFADTAEKAVLTELTRQGLEMREEKAKFVRFLLGNINNLLDKKRPFLWESVYDDPKAPQEGLFQGRLVARTFLEHIQITNTVDKDYRVQEKPVGALILAIQVVHRALLYSVTGVFQFPAEKKATEFSKTNWGDHTIVTAHGEKVVKRASVFLNKIMSLKDEQWDDIFERALAFQVAVGKRASEKAVAEGQSESESDDDELLDPRYDTIPEGSNSAIISD